MKKIISNSLLTTIFIISIVEIILISKLTCGLHNAPQMVIHITEPFPSYYIQDKTIARWESYCLISLVFICLISISSILALLYSNFFSKNRVLKTRKIINNVILSFLIVFLIISIIMIGILQNQIISSPELLVHVIPQNGTRPYVVSQSELVNHWKTLCTTIIIFACISLLTMILFLIQENFLKINETNPNRKELRKAKRIEKLEAELEELKKDE